MRICLLCYRANPYSGGQGIYLKYVAEELVRQGHEVHAVTGPPYPFPMKGVIEHRIDNNQYYIKKGTEWVNPENPFEIFNPINFYEYYHTRLGAFSEISSFSYRAYFRVRELHERYRFDIIHDNQCLGYGLLLMRTLGIPVVATIHHPLTIDLENAIERAEGFVKKFRFVMFYPIMMQRIVSPRLDHIITVSEDSKRAINRDFAVPLEKQSVVYNGIDRTIFHPVRGAGKKKNNIIFVGNVEDGKKGFAYLLKAMSLLENNVNLTVVDGGSPHRRITNALIYRFRLHDRVHFAGKATTGELVRMYSEAEIAIVPSVYEGFGFPAAEAMSCGLPVIASDGGALPEVVGNTGVVVPARDEAALARAIDELIADRKKLKLYGQQGIKRVENMFTWENAVHKMTDIYNKVIKERQG